MPTCGRCDCSPTTPPWSPRRRTRPGSADTGWPASPRGRTTGCAPCPAPLSPSGCARRSTTHAPCRTARTRRRATSSERPPEQCGSPATPPSSRRWPPSPSRPARPSTWHWCPSPAGPPDSRAVTWDRARRPRPAGWSTHGPPSPCTGARSTPLSAATCRRVDGSAGRAVRGGDGRARPRLSRGRSPDRRTLSDLRRQPVRRARPSGQRSQLSAASDGASCGRPRGTAARTPRGARPRSRPHGPASGRTRSCPRRRRTPARRPVRGPPG